MASDPHATDVRFWFDPTCPFAWMTSKWLRLVLAERDYAVEWRLISLRMLNAGVDYDTHFPPEYEAGHTAGLRLLRVVARARDEHGPEVVGPLYEAMGTRIFDTPPDSPEGADSATGRENRGTREYVVPLLEQLGLPAGLADALDDESWDDLIRAETDEALALTGKDVGTPIIWFRAPERRRTTDSDGPDGPDGIAFFGPVISRLPAPEEAAELWDHVVGLASFPGFAELKRSLRERPQLVGFGVEEGAVGQTEDWHGGSRRQKK
ncbi:DSBA oxidoreductase [Marmoricola endophyticus]|uniref:DSBA oxidoreductase n=1 Tax=Marmoricola endophyticus TaxID=2040280 RepID=A0A917BMV6_9ACTN|nr:hypothetical protein [Marmoricola endophyticus]GGF46799.1 DSBA oxidoreductase [Marmoricola endophyticus]